VSVQNSYFVKTASQRSEKIYGKFHFSINEGIFLLRRNSIFVLVGKGNVRAYYLQLIFEQQLQHEEQTQRGNP